MRSRQTMVTGLAAVVAVGIAACGAEQQQTATAPSMDPARVQLAGKADADSVSINSAKGGYKVVRLQGAPAKDLWDVMAQAGSFRSVPGQLSYLVGTYSICASDGAAATCNIYSRQVEGAGGRFEAKVHGRRFASAASELFGAIAAAQGISPTAVSAVESAQIACGKNARDVWCGFDADTSQATGQQVALRVSFRGLEALGAGYVYEGWLITADGPVSAGRFTDPSGYEVKVAAAVADKATLYVLTIEPKDNDDPTPSATHVVAGELTKGRAALSIAHSAALGSDFTSATGGFFLETPTSAPASDYDQGIWFLDPAAGPGPSLSLPTLPAGWVYEGWVVVDGKPVSTGRFSAASGADQDGAGPAAGSGGAPPFPGQDYIDPKLVLGGGKAVISVEPDPDDSPGPFALKPLLGEIAAVGPGQLQAQQNIARATAITGVAIFSRVTRGERVVVANRGGASISVLDGASNSVLWTVAMPDDGEPMYVTYDRKRDRVLVGDRKHHRVVAFDARDFSVAGFAAAGKGVFHMWGSRDNRRLWVVNEIDKTLTVIDQASLEPVATVTIPQDLVAAGGKPHDVIVDPYGHAAYTTVVGLPGKSVVLKISSHSYKVLARADVGGDAHLSLNQRDGLLYVPCQEADAVYLLRRFDLAAVGHRTLPGAHGAGMAPGGRHLYIGNLPAAGPMAVYTMDLAQRSVVGQPVDVPSDGKPHNLAVSRDGKKLFVTHSGPSAKRVSVLSLDDPAQPKLVQQLEAGANPFGLVAYSR